MIYLFRCRSYDCWPLYFCKMWPLLEYPLSIKIQNQLHTHKKNKKYRWTSSLFKSVTNELKSTYIFIFISNISVSVTDLPLGVPIFIDIIPYKDGIRGLPFTIPLSVKGTPDVTINIIAKLLKSTGTSVELSWSPPNGERYNGKELEYQVYYTQVKQISMEYFGKKDCEYFIKSFSFSTS